MDLAAAFVPAAERVSGDFYLVAEGPQHSTVLVVSDVVGHGLHAAQRAAFVRTAFASTAPFSDDPRKLLGWVNAAMVERAGPTFEFVTAACVTYLPNTQVLRWAYAGHPPAPWLHSGRQLAVPSRACPWDFTTSRPTPRDRIDPMVPPACCSIPTGSPKHAGVESSSDSTG